MRKYRSCPICHENDYTAYFGFSKEVLRKKYHLRTRQIKHISGKEDGTIDVVICNSCRMLYVRNYYEFSEMRNSLKMPLDKPLSQLGLKEKHRDMPVERFLHSYLLVQQIIRLIPNNKKEIRILDFGGGYAGIPARLANIYGRTKCIVYDPIIEKDEIDDIRFTNDFAELKDHGPFDGIFCNQVLEHCTEPRRELENIYCLLGKDGVAILGVPLINYRKLKVYLRDIKRDIGKASKIFHPAHINYFSPSVFVKMLKNTGFEILPFQLNIACSKPSLHSPAKNLFMHSASLLRHIGFYMILKLNAHNSYSGFFSPQFFVKKKQTII